MPLRFNPFGELLLMMVCVSCSQPSVGDGAEGEVSAEGEGESVGEGEGEAVPVGEEEGEPLGEGEGEIPITGEGEGDESDWTVIYVDSQAALEELTGVEYVDEVTIDGPITNLDALASLRSTVLHITELALITEIRLPALESGTVSVRGTPVERIVLPSMTEAVAIFASSDALVELDAPLLRNLRWLLFNSNQALTTIRVPNLETAVSFSVQDSPLLTVLEAGSLAEVTQLRLFSTGLSVEEVAVFELLDDPED